MLDKARAIAAQSEAMPFYDEGHQRKMIERQVCLEVDRKVDEFKKRMKATRLFLLKEIISSWGSDEPTRDKRVDPNLPIPSGPYSIEYHGELTRGFVVGHLVYFIHGDEVLRYSVSNDYAITLYELNIDYKPYRQFDDRARDIQKILEDGL